MITGMEYCVRLEQKVAFLFSNEALLRSTNTTECPCDINMVKNGI